MPVSVSSKLHRFRKEVERSTISNARLYLLSESSSVVRYGLRLRTSRIPSSSLRTSSHFSWSLYECCGPAYCGSNQAGSPAREPSGWCNENVGPANTSFRGPRFGGGKGRPEPLF